jgi:hypothetical protein
VPSAIGSACIPPRLKATDHVWRGNSTFHSSSARFLNVLADDFVFAEFAGELGDTGDDKTKHYNAAN